MTERNQSATKGCAIGRAVLLVVAVFTPSCTPQRQPEARPDHYTFHVDKKSVNPSEQTDAQSEAPTEESQAPFPSAVAGFRFGADFLESRETCDQALRREMALMAFDNVPSNLRLQLDHMDSGVCATLPINPFAQTEAIALLRFCNGALCEIALTFSNAHDVSLVLPQLRQRYGEPVENPRPQPIGCPGFSETRLFWKGRSVETGEIGLVRLLSECVSQAPVFSLFYDTKAGLDRRVSEMNERDVNY